MSVNPVYAGYHYPVLSPPHSQCCVTDAGRLLMEGRVTGYINNLEVSKPIIISQCCPTDAGRLLMEGRVTGYINNLEVSKSIIIRKI